MSYAYFNNEEGARARFRCIEPAGVAYRRSPNIDDLSPDVGPSYRDLVIGKIVGSNWLKTEIGYLPLVIGADVLFERLENKERDEGAWMSNRYGSDPWEVPSGRGGCGIARIPKPLASGCHDLPSADLTISPRNCIIFPSRFPDSQPTELPIARMPKPIVFPDAPPAVLHDSDGVAGWDDMPSAPPDMLYDNDPIEAPVVNIVQKFVEVPQVEVVEKVVEVPETVFNFVEVLSPRVEERVVEHMVEVPQIEWVNHYVEVPQVIEQDVIIEVPQIEYVEVPREVKVEIERVVEVPQPLAMLEHVTHLPRAQQAQRNRLYEQGKKKPLQPVPLRQPPMPQMHKAPIPKFLWPEPVRLPGQGQSLRFPAVQPSPCFELTFEDLDFHSLDQAMFRSEMSNALCRLGAEPAAITSLLVRLREGSVIANVSGPAWAVRQISELPLERLNVLGYRAQIRSKVPIESDGPRVPPVDPFRIEPDAAFRPPVPPVGPCRMQPDTAFAGASVETIQPPTLADEKWLPLSQSPRRQPQRASEFAMHQPTRAEEQILPSSQSPRWQQSESAMFQPQRRPLGWRQQQPSESGMRLPTWQEREWRQNSSGLQSPHDPRFHHDRVPAWVTSNPHHTNSVLSRVAGCRQEDERAAPTERALSFREDDMFFA